MKRCLVLFIIIVLGTSALAAKYYVDDQTHEFYKRELLNRGWIYGCRPINWSLSEPSRGGFNWAVMQGRIDIMELQLKAGLDPLECGTDVVGISVFTNKPNSLDFLLKHGFNANEIHIDHSLLTLAIYHKHPQCVKVLIENGADVNMVARGKHPLNSAIKKNNAEVVKLLLDAGAKPNDKTYKLIKRSNNQKIKQLFYEKFPQE